MNRFNSIMILYFFTVSLTLHSNNHAVDYFDCIVNSSDLGCNKGLTDTHKSDECQNYYSFVKSKWEKKEGYYHLQNNPQYLTDATVRLQYFNDGCQIDLTKKRIIKIFGQPNRIDEFDTAPTRQDFIYCMTEKCDRSFVIKLDNEIVTMAVPNPSAIEKD